MKSELSEINHRLERIEQSLKMRDEEDKFIDLERLCILMGIAKRTYYQNHEDYKFRKYKFGKRLQFDRVEVINWMNNEIAATV